MNEPNRLFDCMSVWKRDKATPLLGWKEKDIWKTYTSGEVHEMVLRLCTALLAAGIESSGRPVERCHKVAILSASRPEWIITDLAVQLTGAVLVPLYPNTSNNDIEYILNDTAAAIIFVGNKDDYDKVIAIRQKLQALRKIVCFDEIAGTLYWKDLLTSLTEEEEKYIHTTAAAIDEDDVATIIYTSGTTGKPKGVMLSHKNILSNVVAAYEVLKAIPLKERKALSFLPLNHIFEKMVTYVYLFNRITIYYAQSLDTIGADLKEVKPYVFTAVPRLLEKVYAKIMMEGEKLTGLKRLLFFWAVNIGKRFSTDGTHSLAYQFQLVLAQRLVFSKWQQALGGNVKAIVVGGAACQVELARLFTAAGMVVMEGYGLTETSPVIAVNSFGKKDRRFGTVGTVLSGVKVKIAEDGEIMCSGPNVMKGYYRQEEATDEVWKDSWFYTGDIGEWIEGRFLKITDRKKELFKTSGGKYVAPMPLENKLKVSHLVEQAMVVGQGQKFAAVLIVPSFTSLKYWCEQNTIDYSSNHHIVQDSKVRDLYQSLVERVNQDVNKVEQLKRFVLLPEDWSVEGGELTPKGTLKRKIIAEKYKAYIESLYSI